MPRKDLSIVPLEPHFPGQASYWMQSIGVRVPIISEVGDAVPASDASISLFALGLLDAFDAALNGVSVPTPAPVPAPAPAPAPVVQPATSLVMTKLPNMVRYDGTEADDMQAMTIIAYVKPGVQQGMAYLFGKGDLSKGLRRFFVDNFNRLGFGIGSSGTMFAPQSVTTAGAVRLGEWQHLTATHDGTPSHLGVGLYVNASQPQLSDWGNGAGTLTSDIGFPISLLNRSDGLRPFVGDVGYIAVWRRVLTAAERAAVIASGPDAVPDGRVLHYVGEMPQTPVVVPPAMPSLLVVGTLNITGTMTANADGSITLNVRQA